MTDERKVIVIVGAGFGGIAAYKSLRGRINRRTTRIIIINKTNHFLFTPLLHEVATGGLGVQNATQGVREIIDQDCAQLIKAHVERIDRQAQVVHTTEGPVRYEHLVLATGAATDFMGVQGAAENSLVLKDFTDAITVRARLIDSFEAVVARHHSGQGQGALHFVVVGGGPTGVELTAEIADLFAHTLRRYFKRYVHADQIRITLIHAGPRLLMQFHEKLGHKARQALVRAGVHVITSTRVVRVTPNEVVLEDGTRLSAHTVVWVAGVSPLVPPIEPPLPLTKRGRIITDQTLLVQGCENIWALGDVAQVSDGQGGEVPMRAQAAVMQGPVLARNIIATLHGRKLKAFRYRSKGDLASVGRWYAVGDMGGIRWSGPIAWWVWRTVYLFNMASWSKRIRIAVDWTVNLFFPRDITRS